MQWFGKPVPINRFLGKCDQDDPTNLPLGLAALCRNKDFTRDSGGPTCATTRAGLNIAMALVDPAAPCTGLNGFVWAPESDTDPDFELPNAFQPTVGSQYESPVGTGRMVRWPQTNFTEPQASHRISCVAGNALFAAYSDLKKPLSPMATLDPKAKTMNPYGMRPFGWHWRQLTAGIIENEVATPAQPSTGNGHTYQAQNNGATGPVEPVWPLTEGGTVVEVLSAAQIAAGLTPVTWKEKTMVIANRLPSPLAPVLTRVPAGGTFAAGLDVYVVLTFDNPQGESLPGPASRIINTNLNDAVRTTAPTFASLAGWIQALGVQFQPTDCRGYMAAVATGDPAPPLSAYSQIPGIIPFGTSDTEGSVPIGIPPPTRNSARVTPGQLPTPTEQPIIDRVPGAGAFPGGRDIYFLKTFRNAMGETPAGPANSIINSVLNDAVQITVDVPTGDQNQPLYSIQDVGIYEADVPTGDPAPPSDAFCLVGYYAMAATPLVTTTAAGPNPPTVNTTGNAGNVQADTPDGGANGGQGYRYASLMFVNQRETVSGFTRASVVFTDIDEDGWEIGAFNILLGPANTAARIMTFTGADASQSGPFWYTGLLDLLDPSQNDVYPTQTLIDGVEQSSTIIADNTTTQATFNFTDDYLFDQTNADDRLSLVTPPSAVRADYLKSVDRIALTGVQGFTTGTWISLGADYESFDGADSIVPLNTKGQKCYGVTDEYKGVIIAMCSDQAYTLTANTGNPNSWNAEPRWGSSEPGKGQGPCGFRAWAACGKFIIFAHRTGLFKYDEADPDMMSKEIPREWTKINWAAAETICVEIDEDTHTVRVLVPMGNSTIPNQELCLSYIEGWNNPIHFSTYSGKEIAMDACRRWSVNDVQAYVVTRMLRTLPPDGNAFIDGPAWNSIPDSGFATCQLLYGSSGPDGSVHARTPGVFADNGTGIDDQYETVSASLMQMTCKAEGLNLNAVGGGIGGPGLIFLSFLGARDMKTQTQQGTVLSKELKVRGGDGIPITPDQSIGITAKVGPKLNEYWRVRITNGKIAGNWNSIKFMTVYIIPQTVGRDATDRAK